MSTLIKFALIPNNGCSRKDHNKVAINRISPVSPVIFESVQGVHPSPQSIGTSTRLAGEANFLLHLSMSHVRFLLLHALGTGKSEKKLD